MPNTININPILTTNVPGSFSSVSGGLVQGMAYDDPAIRYALAGGVVDPTETLPMWGGIAIFEKVPSNSSGLLGGNIGRATSIASTKAVTGFSVFNQGHAGLTTPQSPVPVYLPSMSANFYRLGSGQRIAVAADPSLVSLDGGLINQQVSWDFVTQRLQPYDAATATYAISTAVWASTNGGRITIVMSAAVPFGLGDTITISGATNSGTGGTAAINTSFVIDTFTDSTHFTVAAPAAAGVIATIGGSPVVAASVGALPVKILLIQPTGCKVVAYDAVNGYATWNNNGACALILI